MIKRLLEPMRKLSSMSDSSAQSEDQEWIAAAQHCECEEQLLSEEISGPISPEMLSQVSDFFCLGNYCQKCLKEHLACPSINEIIAGTKFYQDEPAEYDEDPPTYEEVMNTQQGIIDPFYK